jgi:ribosomal protein L16/L10AE
MCQPAINPCCCCCVALSLPHRLQTGMRGAFGKPQGVCARVQIGQILLSIRCRDQHANVVSVTGGVFRGGVLEGV